MTKPGKDTVNEEPKQLTEAEKMWNEIKDKSIEMFGLPDQVIAMHCGVVTVDPSVLYLTVRSSAVLPSLEAAISPAFTVEMADKYVLVKRAPKPLFPAKKK